MELKLRDIWICWGVFKDSVEKNATGKGYGYKQKTKNNCFERYLLAETRTLNLGKPSEEFT